MDSTEFLSNLNDCILSDRARHSSCLDSYQEFSFDLFASDFKKKYKSISESSIAASKDKFLKSNLRCKHYSLDSFSEIPIGLFNQLRYEFKNFSESILDSEEDYIFGPGASRGFKVDWFGDKLTNFSFTTNEVRSLFLSSSFDNFRSILTHFRNARDSGRVIQIQSSKAHFVPKNIKSARMICVEPSCNMFLQKGYGRRIESFLRDSYRIDIQTQQFTNRKLAKMASIFNSHATIDLSSASDSMSIEFLRYFLEPVVFESLYAIRTPYVSLDGEEIELHMISSQGNATTFPLQTYIFSSIVRSVYSFLNIPLTVDGIANFSVFGDDIIVANKSIDLVLKLLSACGFIINDDKTFITGPFRESCGGDYYLGRNCRPVYLYGDQLHDIYSFLNRLIIWQAKVGIFLLDTNKYLLKMLPFLPIPLHADISSGIRTPLVNLQQRYFNKRYQCYEYRCYTIDSRSIDLDNYSPSILLTCFLGSYIVSGSASSRVFSTRYTLRKRFTSCWDNTEYGDLLMEDVSLASYIDTMVSVLY